MGMERKELTKARKAEYKVIIQFTDNSKETNNIKQNIFKIIFDGYEKRINSSC